MWAVDSQNSQSPVELWDASSSPYTFTPPSNAAKYFLVAITSDAESAYSNYAYAPGEAPTPAAPQNLTATPYSDGTGSGIRLLWDNTPDNELGFVINRRVSGTTTWSQLTTVGMDVTAYTDTSAAPGVSYDYQVGSQGTGDVVTFPGTPDNPSFVTATIPLPTVSVTALPVTAEEEGPNGEPQDGYFQVSRTGDTSAELPVSISDSSLSGSAYEVTDLQTGQTMTDSVDIPAGMSSAVVSVARDPSTDSAAADTFTADLVPDPSDYQDSSAMTASVNVVGIPEVGALRVTDSSMATNYAEANSTTTAPTVYVVKTSVPGRSWDAEVQLTSDVALNGAGFSEGLLKWSVDGAGVVGAATGSFLGTHAEPNEYVGPTIKLSAASNSSFTIHCWYDANNNGIVDAGEESETVNVKVVTLTISGTYVNHDDPTNTTPQPLPTGMAVPVIYGYDEPGDPLASDSLTLSGSTSNNVTPLSTHWSFSGVEFQSEVAAAAPNVVIPSVEPTTGPQKFTFYAEMPSGVTLSVAQPIDVGVRTPEYTMVGWQDPIPYLRALPGLAAAAGPFITKLFPVAGPVATGVQALEAKVMIATLEGGGLEFLFPGLVGAALTAPQASYLLDWFNAYTGNPVPPPNFTTNGLLDRTKLNAYAAVSTNYRLFNDFKIDYVPNAGNTRFASYRVITAATHIGGIIKPYGGLAPVPGYVGPAETNGNPKVLAQNSVAYGLSSINDGAPEEGIITLYNTLYGSAFAPTNKQWEDYGSAITIKPTGEFVATEPTFPNYDLYIDGVPQVYLPGAVAIFGSNFANFPYPSAGARAVTPRWATGLI